MSIRHVARTVAASVAGIAAIGAFSAIALASPAGATTPTQGSIVAGAAQPQQPNTPGTPFQSGQQIDVVVPGGFFPAGDGLQIVECSAPGGNIPTSTSACDGNTVNALSLEANSDGSVDYQGYTGSLYPIYALPDKTTLGEGTSGPKCNASTNCILYIGENFNNFTALHVWSQPFQIVPDAGDAAPNPGDGTPEVPLAVLLPLSAMGLLAGIVLVRRRRAEAAA
jgi:hypothetical protein